MQVLRLCKGRDRDRDRQMADMGMGMDIGRFLDSLINHSNNTKKEESRELLQRRE